MRADGNWPQPRHQAATTCTTPSHAYLNGIDKGDAPSEPCARPKDEPRTITRLFPICVICGYPVPRRTRQPVATIPRPVSIAGTPALLFPAIP